MGDTAYDNVWKVAIKKLFGVFLSDLKRITGVDADMRDTALGRRNACGNRAEIVALVEKMRNTPDVQRWTQEARRIYDDAHAPAA